MSLKITAEVQHSGEFNLSVDLNIDTDRVTALYGASGSGKTTLLRVIAGLERCAGATVIFNNEIWQNSNIFIPTHKRKIGYVFQHLHLFPHLSAAENLNFAMRRNSPNNGLSFNDTVDMLDIGNLLGKNPTNLSGGEQQRVAIARALLSNPQLLVMDEPLGSIDTSARNRILPYLQRLQVTMNIPVIYVSHALDEVLELADDVILLSSGRATAKKTVFDFAITGPDAELPHGTAMIRCRVTGRDPLNELTLLSFENQKMYLANSFYSSGDTLRIRIPARDVSLALTKPEGSSILNIIEGQIKAIHTDNASPAAVVVVRCGNQQILARITRKSLSDMKLTVGQQIFAQIKGVALIANHDR